MYETIAIIAVFVFLYSITSKGLELTPINGAVVFTAFGFIFGPVGLDLLSLDINTEGLRLLAELTLALVLFIDAANADIGILKKNFHIPQRLLLIGLPLTILLGFGFGFVIFDELSLFEVAILATLLAPTDAALGKAVVSDKSVPANIRQSLNVESGLNDGICVPVLFVFLALAAGSGAHGDSTSALVITLVAEELGIGIAVGVGLTILGTLFMKYCADRGWITETWRQLPVIALAVACFSLAQFIGGSGFIACFVGGFLFGGIAKDLRHGLLLAAEGTGDTMALITWVVFGAAVIGQRIDALSWEVVIYAVLSLTVIRMLPVFISLSKTNLKTSEKLFLGWFGPRGLASIVFAVIVLSYDLPGGDTIILTTVCTIILSVIGHGVSANPLIAALAKRVKS
jgi:NhaP-type Na+/H+ or K+/H+ antiporter